MLVALGGDVFVGVPLGRPVDDLPLAVLCPRVARCNRERKTATLLTLHITSSGSSICSRSRRRSQTDMTATSKKIAN